MISLRRRAFGALAGTLCVLPFRARMIAYHRLRLGRLLARLGGDIDAVCRVGPRGRRIRIGAPMRQLAPLSADVYEVPLREQLVEHASRHAVFVDAGAHLGYFSVLCAAINPELTVISVEPNERTVRRLEENVRHNDLANLSVVPLALDERVGTAAFEPGSTSGSFSAIASLVKDVATATATRVQTCTLDALVDGAAPGDGAPVLIKIDVEGAEAEVLRGAMATLRSRPCTVFVELNAVRDRHGDDALDLLHELDYVTHVVGHRGTTAFVRAQRVTDVNAAGQ